jgi:hypothetical protein
MNARIAIPAENSGIEGEAAGEGVGVGLNPEGGDGVGVANGAAMFTWLIKG